MLTMMVVAPVRCSGVALGAVKLGTNGSDYLVGTKGKGVLYGQADSAIIHGKGFDYVF